MIDKDRYPEAIQERLEEMEQKNFVLKVRAGREIRSYDCERCGAEIEGDMFVPKEIGPMCKDCWLEWLYED